MKRIVQRFSILSFLTFFIIGSLLSEERGKIGKGSFVSKWDRVVELAKEITRGDVVYRLYKKNEILDILMSEEDNYPIYYVDQNATGNGDGSSWENAFTEIQPAINLAAQSEGWVWVAKGVYTGSYWESDLGNYREVAAIKVKSRVMLFGGFRGDETHLIERDPEANETVIQNQNGPGPDGPRAVDMAHMSLIDGFTIRNSGFTELGVKLSDYVCGGGIRTKDWFVVIRNNRITGNYAKGGASIAVWNRSDRSSETIDDYAPIIEGNFIYRNCGVCGAVQIRNSETLFCNNVVAYNYHDAQEGEADRSKGVEIVLDLELSDKPIIVNSILWNNTGNGTFPDLYNHVNNPPGAEAESYYNCIRRGGYGEGLVTSDPMFKDPANNDFSLLDESPCIDAGHPNGPKDPDNTRADIGVFTLRYQLTIDDGGVGANTVGEGNYTPGRIVTISIDSIVVDSSGKTRYRFLRWEGEGPGSYSGTSVTATVMMLGPIKETAVWKEEYWLEVNSGVEADTLTGWYEKGSSQQIWVHEYYNIADGERNHFIRWEGDGSGSYTGTDTLITVVLNEPVVESVVWEREYYLNVVSSFGSPSGEGWYLDGDTATFSITGSQNSGPSTRYSFKRWVGTGEGSYTGSDTIHTVIMNNPITETAEWDVQYFLDIISDHGSPSGEGWYDANSVVKISIDTLDYMDQQRRYHFIKWEGSGSEWAYTGEDPSPLIHMKGPVTESAVWNLEYWTSIELDPPEGGSVEPFSPPGIWCTSGSELRIYARPDYDGGYGFKGWFGDVSCSDDSLILDIDGPLNVTARFRKGNIIIRTVPQGLTFIADQIEYQSPMVFFWSEGEEKSLNVPSPQSGGKQVRYIFNRWSDGLSKNHQITVPEDTTIYTAYFDTSYFLKIDSEYGTPMGEGWYNPGSTAQVSIDSIAEDTVNVRQRFIKWTGVGDGSVNSSARNILVTVNGPVVQTAHWTPQYYLTTQVVPEQTGSIVASPSHLWYDDGTEVGLLAAGKNSNIKFIGWSGDLDGNTNPTVIEMDSPKLIVAHFNAVSNYPPVFTSALSDTTIFEDNDLIFSFSYLEKFLNDQNDCIESLKYELNEESHFTVEKDIQSSVLILHPQSNWYGAETVVLNVSDPWELTTSDTFDVTVFPVNDPPLPFDLLIPQDGTVLSGGDDPVEFVWQKSLNVDKEPDVTYEFFLGPDSNFTDIETIQISVGSDTSIDLNRNIINGEKYWGVLAVDSTGLSRWCRKRFKISIKTGVISNDIPDRFFLAPNYPNPFNSETQIYYQIPENGYMWLKIYDERGRVIKTLRQGWQVAGCYIVKWDGRNENGDEISSGIYIIRLQMNDLSVQRKVVLVR